jgi:hypothetical protein
MNGCSNDQGHYHDITGFVYVTGDLKVAALSTAWWAIDGVVRVDGTMWMTGGSFQLTGSDVVNHAIRTANFELQIDSMTAIP